jgi:hypothetical protein
MIFCRMRSMKLQVIGCGVIKGGNNKKTVYYEESF